MDRLRALVEGSYKEMFSRVQALEVHNMQKDGDSCLSEDDVESLATIRPQRPIINSEESLEGGPVRFEFSEELQRSRVYMRTKAFSKSVISALTRSEYSLGSSVFSGLSLSEVSNISVINLAITEREVYNPARSSQTWPAQGDRGVLTDVYLDGRRTQLYKVIQEEDSTAIPRGRWSASSLPRAQSLLLQSHVIESSDVSQQPGQGFEVQESTAHSEDLHLTTTLSPLEPSNPLPPSQAKDTFDARHQSKDRFGEESVMNAQNSDPTSSQSLAKLLDAFPLAGAQSTFEIHCQSEERSGEKESTINTENLDPTFSTSPADPLDLSSSLRAQAALDLCHQSEQRFEDKDSLSKARNSDSISSLPPADPLNPLSPSQPQATCSPHSNKWTDAVEYAEYLCKGCGKVRFTLPCCLSAKIPLCGLKC